MITDDQIFTTLADTFGFHSFKPHQEEIVRAIISGQDVFAVMPTGGGKSLCYQLPAMLLDGACVVVSPLISLMKDQVDAARANGIKAATLNSSITQSERSRITSALCNGDIKLLYISPERFNSEFFLDILKSVKISFFAIDEAHCISEWGHDFRRDYLELSKIVTEFPDVPIAAFTATATSRVANDITVRLKLRNPHLTRASFDRPNLFYRVVIKQNVEDQLYNFVLRHKDEAGIIYRISRKKVEQTAMILQSHGIAARAYHAGMSDSDRHAAQEAFSRDECSVIVATIAFGMGIDKSNVRYVVHGDLPKNIEGYYQETGRAGRDGTPAECVLFYDQQDIIILSKFADNIEDPAARDTARTQLFQMRNFAERDACRRTAILRYFGETYTKPNCGGCDFCLGDIEREDATINAQKVLSAIYRTGERFGAVHICDIVTGANTEKIRDFNHNALPTYGVGKDQPKQYWRSLVNALLAKQILTIDDPQLPTLKLTDDARKILRGQLEFQLQTQKKQPVRSVNRYTDGITRDFDDRLFQLLRGVRTKIAIAENIAPFVVFADRSLIEMSTFFPQNETEFTKISGVGHTKFERYGEQFIDEIKRYCQEN